MDLKQLSYIVAIADEQNLSKAAEKLYISQPALSLCLSRLEENLGLKLFERKKNAMELTEAGRLYVAAARKMLAMKDELYQELGQLSASKTSVLKIGIVPMTCGPMFTFVYPQYRNLYPNVAVQVSEDPSRALEKLLLDKKIRLAFLTYLPTCTENSLTYQVLKKEPFCIGIRADHPLTAKLELLSSSREPAAGNVMTASVPIRIFQDLPFILSPPETNRRRLEDLTFEQAGFKPQISCEINSIPTIRRMVAEGAGVAFFAEGYTLPARPMPDQSAALKKGAVRYFYIDSSPFWNIGAAHLRSVKLAPHEKQFLSLAQEYFRTHFSYS